MGRRLRKPLPWQIPFALVAGLIAASFVLRHVLDGTVRLLAMAATAAVGFLVTWAVVRRYYE